MQWNVTSVVISRCAVGSSLFNVDTLNNLYVIIYNSRFRVSQAVIITEDTVYILNWLLNFTTKYLYRWPIVQPHQNRTWKWRTTILTLWKGNIKESPPHRTRPMVCVKTKDMSLRLCTDNIVLNQKTVPTHRPIHRKQDWLNTLNGNEWFSTLDEGKPGLCHIGQGFLKFSLISLNSIRKLCG